VPRLTSKIETVCAVAWVLSACSGGSPLLEKETYSNMFSNSSKLFDVSDLVKTDFNSEAVSLGPSGPVAPEDLVTADGRCGAPAAQAVEPQTPTAAAPEPATAPADRPVGSIAGDLAGAPMPAAPPAPVQASAPPPDRLQLEGQSGGPSFPRVMGGVALGMTECQVVRRAGPPSNVAITAGNADGKGERKVVLTYDGGSWPGIYSFVSGRLQVVEGLPAPSQTAQPKSRRKPAAARSTRQTAGRIYVQ
jgi:hypothetical protein